MHSNVVTRCRAQLIQKGSAIVETITSDGYLGWLMPSKSSDPTILTN